MTAGPLRGSWQSRTVRQMSALTVRHLAEATPVNAWTLPTARLLIDRALRATAPPPRGTVAEPVRCDRVTGEWVRGPGSARTDAVVLYVHGGGFVAGSATAYRGVAARLSSASGLPVCTLDYRLAPEHPWPAAAHDVADAFQWLLSRGYRSDRVIVAGDSAGGFLTADFAISAGRSRLPAPGAVVLFSPMADLGLTLAEAFAGARADGLLSSRLSRRTVAQFTPDPFELLPVAGTPLPPALVHASDSELFGGDAVALAERWQATGARCELKVWRDQMHAFQLLPVLIPETRFAYRSAARFISSVLDTAAVAV